MRNSVIHGCVTVLLEISPSPVSQDCQTYSTSYLILHKAGIYRVIQSPSTILNEIFGEII
jgi:hypothetical protein